MIKSVPELTTLIEDIFKRSVEAYPHKKSLLTTYKNDFLRVFTSCEKGTFLTTGAKKNILTTIKKIQVVKPSSNRVEKASEKVLLVHKNPGISPERIDSYYALVRTLYKQDKTRMKLAITFFYKEKMKKGEITQEELEKATEKVLHGIDFIEKMAAIKLVDYCIKKETEHYVFQKSLETDARNYLGDYAQKDSLCIIRHPKTELFNLFSLSFVENPEKLDRSLFITFTNKSAITELFLKANHQNQGELFLEILKFMGELEKNMIISEEFKEAYTNATLNIEMLDIRVNKKEIDKAKYLRK